MLSRNRRAFSLRTLAVDLGGGRAQQVGDQLQLVHDVAPGEQGLALEHLGEDAADRPDVDRGRVAREERAAELGGAVPARGDVVGPAVEVDVGEWKNGSVEMKRGGEEEGGGGEV